MIRDVFRFLFCSRPAFLPSVDKQMPPLDLRVRAEFAVDARQAALSLRSPGGSVRALTAKEREEAVQLEMEQLRQLTVGVSLVQGAR